MSDSAEGPIRFYAMRIAFVPCQPLWHSSITNRSWRSRSLERPWRSPCTARSVRRMTTMEQKGPLDSGYISTLPKPQQGAITLGMTVGVTLLTCALMTYVVPVLRTAPLARPASRLAGILYAVAGVGHFTMLEDFCDVYPERGAWGWWYLPGTAKFHVEWTGVAEILGGLAVLCGDLPFLPQWVGPYGAFGLFLLTIVVTPANLFSVTHGRSGPAKTEIPWYFHIFRMLLQPGLLAICLSMATGYRA